MFVDEGLIAEQEVLLYSTDPALQVLLYNNSLTIANSTVLSALTEATFPGYARQTTLSIAFPDPAIDGTGAALTTSPVFSFTASSAPGSPETIYGIAVKITDRHGTDKLWFAENFTTPIVIAAGGDAVVKRVALQKKNY